MLGNSCIDITFLSVRFFRKNAGLTFKETNTLLNKITGIFDFFESEEEFVQFNAVLTNNQNTIFEGQVEYGDYQTNEILAQKVCNKLSNKNVNPTVLLEPTCGKGNFILAAVKTFSTLEKVFGIEIQNKYLWNLKLNLLEYFLKNPQTHKPEIYLFNANIFDFNFHDIKNKINGHRLLVIGNPPWVTNSQLSALNSVNLPVKSNFKQVKGIDAITGKSNFDISEYISLKMLKLFSAENGYFAFLIKNSVIKNIVYEQKHNKYPIAEIEKYTINAKKEFGAAVDASLFICQFNSEPEFTAKEYDFYTLQKHTILGWINNKFASDIEKYERYQYMDGICPYEWRQGIKHDCAKVMELERIKGGFRNQLGEEFELEEDLVYGILKSSDLKEESIDTSRKYTIITQKHIGQDTTQILERLPKTKAYLEKHKNYFLQRKSSIYKGKPMYAIFGVGDYSFKPYKVAISGLYKQTKFSLIKPNSTVLLLDDTCYFIGFDKIEDALKVQAELNNPEMQSFIQSFMFTDAKRAITKDLLMRISLKS